MLGYRGQAKGEICVRVCVRESCREIGKECLLV